MEIFALVGAFIVIGLVFVTTLSTGASPVPTSPTVRRTMMTLLPKRLPDPDGVIYELGAGWGGLALTLARRYPNHAVVGLEVSLIPWIVARLRFALTGPANLSLRRRDFIAEPLSNATLVTCYLPPEAAEGLREKLEAELPPGALVVANTFAIRPWRPLDEVTAPDIYASKVYLYEIGAVAAASQVAVDPSIEPESAD